MLRSILVVAVLLISCNVFAARAPGGGSEPPAIFDKRSYTDAKKAAEDGKKWFIVKATASWCMPCKKMDATTWVDDKVIKWAKDNAIVVAVDVDTYQDLAASLAIDAMPTMIAFKDGKEFDRVVGYQGPAELMEWLQGVAKGEKSIEAVKKRAKGGADGKEDVRARYDLARKLAQDGKFDLATDEYVWLWQNMLEHDPAMAGVRGSFMASDMERLAAKSAEAKKKFTLLRDRVGPSIQQDKVDSDALDDWLVLNKVIGDSKTTMDWFDKVKDQGKWKSMLVRQSYRLGPTLIEAKRWADVARLYPDPMQHLEQERELLKMISRQPRPNGVDDKGVNDEMRKILEESPKRLFRENVSKLYAALLAGARDKEAQAYADRARELDDSGAMVRALVSTALDAEQPRKVHVDWLQAENVKKSEPDAGSEGTAEELRKRLESALRKSDDVRKESK